MVNARVGVEDSGSEPMFEVAERGRTFLLREVPSSRRLRSPFKSRKKITAFLNLRNAESCPSSKEKVVESDLFKVSLSLSLIHFIVAGSQEVMGPEMKLTE
jgi:hypothetical protein